ncbi:hypothetical protein FACS1894186_2630 [Alphaproteobacteria bacterium]|nr:hypothetical protein FACS1894186_2630 [Alphaproteobacteria bacterium]
MTNAQQLIAGIMLAALAGCGAEAGDIASVKGAQFKMKDSAITLAFAADGNKISGRAVNRFTASYTSGGDGKITFAPMASTMMMGLPDKMEEESKFFKAMANVNAYRINGQTITFTTSDGQSLVFEKAQMPAEIAP